MAVRPPLLIPVVVFLAHEYCRVPAKAFLGAQVPALAGALAAGSVVWLLRAPAESVLGGGAALGVLGAAGIAIYGLVLNLLAPGTVRQLLVLRAHHPRE